MKDGIGVFYEHNKEVAFVTNNSVKLREKFETSFKALGVRFDYDKHLVHPAASIISYLKSNQFNGKIFLIGSSVLKEMLTKNGFDFFTAVNISSTQF